MLRSLILYTIDHKLNYFIRPIERGSFSTEIKSDGLMVQHRTA